MGVCKSAGNQQWTFSPAQRNKTVKMSNSSILIVMVPKDWVVSVSNYKHQCVSGKLIWMKLNFVSWNPGDVAYVLFKILYLWDLIYEVHRTFRMFDSSLEVGIQLSYQSKPVGGTIRNLHSQSVIFFFKYGCNLEFIQSGLMRGVSEDMRALNPNSSFTQQWKIIWSLLKIPWKYFNIIYHSQGIPLQSLSISKIFHCI